MNIHQKKQIKERLKNIKDNNLLIKVYTILQTDTNFKPTFNSNGAYFNITSIDNDTLLEINKLLNLNTNIKLKEKLTYNSYYNETDDDRLYKKLISLNI